jgi:hypothetical protein
MAKERKSARAEHGDRRLQQTREKYGDLANLTVQQLQQRAKEQGIEGGSGMRKEELLRKLSGGKQ